MTSTILHEIKGHTNTHVHTWQNTHLFYPAILSLSCCHCSSVFFLSFFILICCAHYSSTLNSLLPSSLPVCHAPRRTLHLFLFIFCSSLCFSLFSLSSFSLATRVPLCDPSLCQTPFSSFLSFTFLLSSSRLSVWNWRMGWDYSLQSGGRGRTSEAWWCSGLYLDHQGSPSVQGQYERAVEGGCCGSCLLYTFTTIHFNKAKVCRSGLWFYFDNKYTGLYLFHVVVIKK